MESDYVEKFWREYMRSVWIDRHNEDDLAAIITEGCKRIRSDAGFWAGASMTDLYWICRRALRGKLTE